jgi:tetratricopeptide (TPR) repeat protein
MRAFVLGTLLVASIRLFGQAIDAAKQVYDLSQNSVFLIYLNDSSGSPTALGSGFLVGSRMLATNAHVANAGSPVLSIGPVRIPLKVLRTDEENDLALLTLDADLSSKPLLLSSAAVSPGEQIFAIGNPEGLEKTISQGIVSGLRKRDNRDLIQITSPISHGSSGGPILNVKGEVIGIAVGVLENGQNLNFAVPVSYLKTLIENSGQRASAMDTKSSIVEAKRLQSQRSGLEYSNDPASDYQQFGQRIEQIMADVTRVSNNEDALSDVACLGTKSFEFSDGGIAAAKKLNQLKPSAGHRALLSYLLLDRAQTENFVSLLSEKDSPQKAEAEAVSKKFFEDAAREATDSRKLAKGTDYLLASFVLGAAKDNEGAYSEAAMIQSPVANGNLTVCGVDLVQLAFKNLIDDTTKAKKPEESERWFRQFAAKYQPTGYDWDSEGDRREEAKDFAASADAYERAAADGEYYQYDYCFASSDRYRQRITDQDKVLADGRKCVEASVKNANKGVEHFFKQGLPVVYRDMADVLNTRGAYPSAFEYIKEAISADPQNAFGMYLESQILENMERYSECTAAAQEAVRLSDGAYPFIQFQLGQCYFDSGNWSQAASSYRIAAEANKDDAAAAFNLGLALLKQGFGADAHQWFREALNRNPSSELRGKIMLQLQ